MAGVPSTSRGGSTTAAAFTQITDTTLAADAASITFATIAGTYTHLRVVLRSRSTRASANDTAKLQFNADTATNYFSQVLYGGGTGGSTVVAAEFLTASSGLISYIPAATATASHFGQSETTIPYYADTTAKKTWFSDGLHNEGITTGLMRRVTAGGIWDNTAAVTQILLLPSVGPNFLAGTRATLYGVT